MSRVKESKEKLQNKGEEEEEKMEKKKKFSFANINLVNLLQGMIEAYI
jgi:hypothetical protein